jgi:hypothetical protein
VKIEADTGPSFPVDDKVAASYGQLAAAVVEGGRQPGACSLAKTLCRRNWFRGLHEDVCIGSAAEFLSCDPSTTFFDVVVQDGLRHSVVRPRGVINLCGSLGAQSQ